MNLYFYPLEYIFAIKVLLKYLKYILFIFYLTQVNQIYDLFI